MPAYLTLVDAILAILVLEWLVLRVFHRRSGSGVSPTAMAPNLLAGAALLLAWRCSLVEAAWFWSYLCLLAALAAHVTDLTQRWLRDPFTVGNCEWRDRS
jgi:hypothetical protein